MAELAADLRRSCGELDQSEVAEPSRRSPFGSKFFHWKHSPENNKRLISQLFAQSEVSELRLSAAWLPEFAVSDIMFLAPLSPSAFDAPEPGPLSDGQLTDLAIELVLLIATAFFTVATEKRLLAVLECEKRETGGGRLLGELRVNQSLRRCSLFLERPANQRASPLQKHRAPGATPHRLRPARQFRQLLQEKLLRGAQLHREVTRPRKRTFR